MNGRRGSGFAPDAKLCQDSERVETLLLSERRQSLKITISTVLALALTASLAGVQAAPKDPASAGKHQLDLLKKLEGEWTGKDSAVIYKVTAGGSAVMETLSPGTPHEMVSMYHLDGSDLVMTHYCAEGNQPHLKAAPSKDDKSLSFSCAGGSNMKEGDRHIHSAQFTLTDEDHIQAVWKSLMDGKPGEQMVFDLTRKK